MKPLVLVLSALLTFALTAAAASPGVSYKYDNKFTWDNKRLDSPPLPVGGEPALAKGLDYPVELRERNIHGKTTVSVTVDARGHVQSLRFSPPFPAALARIVRSAVYRCQWKPGGRHGHAVKGTVSFPVAFVIGYP
jgi:Gram-negative bacterial TonB protein C-terminal